MNVKLNSSCFDVFSAHCIAAFAVFYLVIATGCFPRYISDVTNQRLICVLQVSGRSSLYQLFRGAVENGSHRRTTAGFRYDILLIPQMFQNQPYVLSRGNSVHLAVSVFTYLDNRRSSPLPIWQVSN